MRLINRLISGINTQFFGPIIIFYISIIITPGYYQSILLKRKSLFRLFKMLAVFRGGSILKLGMGPAKILEYISLTLAVPWL